MMKTIMASCIIFILGITTACSSQSSKEESIEITISAAASMQTVLTELQDIFEKEHKNIKLLFNFGSSGALQQQIQQGAPVDMFLSASGDKFSILVEKQLIDPLYSVNLVSNELVLIQNKDSKIQLVGFDELSKDSIKRISIGTPESVPAGEYAKEAFKNLDI
jgi:molybdate transport system substrate-binding protein